MKFSFIHAPRAVRPDGEAILIHHVGWKVTGRGMTERPMPSKIPFVCLQKPRYDLHHATVRQALRLYSTSVTTPCSICLRGLDGRALGTCWGAGSEAVAELAVDGLEVSHAAGTGGLPSLGLLAPVDCDVLIFILDRPRHVRG